MKKLALVLTVVASLLGSARSEVPDLDLSPSEIQQIQGEVQQLERLLPKAVDRAEVTYILAADNSRLGGTRGDRSRGGAQLCRAAPTRRRTHYARIDLENG